MTPRPLIHIAQADVATIKVGDLIDQAGITYRVTELRRSPHFNGIEAIYYVWTGSDKSDTFRSIVNSKDHIGQIRWEMPYRKADAGKPASLKVSA